MDTVAEATTPAPLLLAKPKRQPRVKPTEHLPPLLPQPVPLVGRDDLLALARATAEFAQGVTGLRGIQNDLQAMINAYDPDDARYSPEMHDVIDRRLRGYERVVEAIGEIIGQGTSVLDLEWRTQSLVSAQAAITQAQQQAQPS